LEKKKGERPTDIVQTLLSKGDGITEKKEKKIFRRDHAAYRRKGEESEMRRVSQALVEGGRKGRNFGSAARRWGERGENCSANTVAGQRIKRGGGEKGRIDRLRPCIRQEKKKKKRRKESAVLPPSVRRTKLKERKREDLISRTVTTLTPKERKSNAPTTIKDATDRQNDQRGKKERGKRRGISPNHVRAKS